MIRKFLIFALLWLFAHFFSVSYAQSFFEKGVLDLRNWDFVQNPSLELEGEVFFEYGKFLSKQDFDTLRNPEYIKIPSYWNNTYKGAKTIQAQGFATYYFRILLPPNLKTPLAFKIVPDNWAYKVYANGNLLKENGKVGKNAENSQISLAPTIITLPQSDTLEIIFQVSNYVHRETGISEYIRLGTQESLLAKRERRLFFDWFVIGATFIMACYHLGLFLMRRKDQSAWIFSFICTATFLRIGLTGESALIQAWEGFAELPALSKKIEYLTFYGIGMGFAMLLRTLYPLDIPKIITQTTVVISLIFSSLAIVLPVFWSNYLIPYYQYFILSIVLIHIVLIILIAIRKRQGSTILMVAFVIVSLSGFNDVLLSTGIIGKSVILISVGIFIFLFAQSFLLAQRFTASFRLVENLTGELSELNQNLELKVTARTNEINEKNNELNMTIEELHSTVELVNQQKEEIEKQQAILLEAKEEIELKNNSIMGSITYAKRLQTSMLPTHEQIAEYLNDFFIFYRPRDVVSGDFYWYSRLTDDRAMVVVADCTGHGVPGSLMSMIGIELLNKIVNEKQLHDPAMVLSRLNKGIQKTFRQDLSDSKEGMDIAICFLDRHTKKMLYSGAMNPMYYVPTQDTVEIHNLQEIKADKRPVGGTKEEHTFMNHEISFETPLMIYLCTDGFQDQFGGEKNKKYLTKNLRELLFSMSYFPLTEQAEILERAFEEWKGKNRQTDDVAIWGFKIG